MPTFSSPCLLLENTILDRATRYIYLFCRAVYQRQSSQQGKEGRKGDCILASHQCILDKVEVSLAIVSVRPIRQHLLSGAPSSSAPFSYESQGGREDGIAVPTLGKTPHHEFRYTLCPSAKFRTGLALFESLVDTAAGLAAPLSAIESSFTRVQVLWLARQGHLFQCPSPDGSRFIFSHRVSSHLPSPRSFKIQLWNFSRLGLCPTLISVMPS